MAETRHVTCCVAGGGPAGLMLGYLLARAGVEVLVIEKHADFLRDFRGDTLHPSTLEVMHELGLLQRLLRLPHQKVGALFGQFGQTRIKLADLSTLPTVAPYIAMMPQWDFLDFLTREARRYPGFSLMMQTEAQDLVIEDGVVCGVTAGVAGSGRLTVRARLTVAADGRSSGLRAQSGLPVTDIGAPMDALWFRLSRKPSDTSETQGRFDRGRIFVMLNRGDYWQCAFVIPKGSLEALKERGLAAFKSDLGFLVPFEAGRGAEITSWDDVKLLTVQVNRMEKWWRPGLLFIGDAAHAMSPVGGVGINLAIQDAVAAANILAEPLRRGEPGSVQLARVEMRRAFPTRITQRLQAGVQNTVIAPRLEAGAELAPPLAVRLIGRFPILQRIPARLIGMGVRPEHVSAAIVRAGGA